MTRLELLRRLARGDLLHHYAGPFAPGFTAKDSVFANGGCVPAEVVRDLRRRGLVMFDVRLTVDRVQLTDRGREHLAKFRRAAS